MDVNPAQQPYIPVQRLFNPAGNVVPFADANAAVNTDGHVDHEIGAKAMGVDFFDLLHTGNGLYNSHDALGQRFTGNGVHEIIGGFAQDFDAGAQDKEGNNGACQRINPEVSGHPQANPCGRRQR